MLNVVVFEPGKNPYKRTIEKDILTIENIIAGAIEIMPTVVCNLIAPKIVCNQVLYNIFEDDMVIVCNAEGIQRELLENRGGIKGTFLVANLVEPGQFKSLTDEQINKLLGGNNAS